MRRKIAEKAIVFNRNLWYYINVRVFKNTWFTRFARKEDISDEKEKSDYKELAKKYLNLSDEMIDRAVKSGKFIEI